MKFEVTPELSRLIKTFRARFGISSKTLAAHLSKSPSYLSKLEGGGVRCVELDTLRDMLVFIAGGKDFYDFVLPNVASLLMGSTDAAGIVGQAWFLQFDIIERPVEVPPGMAVSIADDLAEIGSTPDQLADLINANLDSEADESMPPNRALALKTGPSTRFLVRVMHDAGAVADVVTGFTSSTTYYMLYTIVHTLLRMRHYPDVSHKLHPDQAISLLSDTAAYMDRWGIHSLSHYSHFLTSDEFIAHQLPLVPRSSTTVDLIADKLEELVEHGSSKADERLHNLLKTLDWDPAFALALYGLPLANLRDLSHTRKSQLLDEIAGIVDKYAGLDDFDRRLESY